MGKLKFKGKKSKGFTPLPAGTYDIEFDDVKTSVSRNGNDTIQIKAHVADGEHEDKKVTIFYTVTEDSLWSLKGLLDASGIEFETEDLGKDEERLAFELDDLIGCVIRYDVAEDEWQGKPKNVYNNPRAIPDDEKSEATTDDAAEDDEAAADEEGEPEGDDAEGSEEGEEDAEPEEDEEEEEEEEEAAPPKAREKVAAAAATPPQRSGRRRVRR